MSSVALREVFVNRGGRPILRGLDFSIPDRFFNPYVVLLGASGCGKTTTLRLIAGLDRPDSGTILIDGKDVGKVPPRRRDVAMVFQADAMYPHLSVAASIAMSAKAGAMSDRNERVGQAIKLTRLESLIDRHPDRLSGGELRRAAIAKAIARGAGIRLLDEPLSALDGSVRYQLAGDLRRWHDNDPGTTIHVTHDGEEAMRLADLIAVMHDGRIEQIGTPSELYERPTSIVVASSLGHPPINFFGDVNGFDGKTIGVRPQRLHWSSNDHDARSIIIGRYRRDEVHASGVNNAVELTATRNGEILTAVVPSDQFCDGDVHVFSVDDDDVIVFDAKDAS